MALLTIQIEFSRPTSSCWDHTTPVTTKVSGIEHVSQYFITFLARVEIQKGKRGGGGEVRVGEGACPREL